MVQLDKQIQLFLIHQHMKPMAIFQMLKIKTTNHNNTNKSLTFSCSVVFLKRKAEGYLKASLDCPYRKDF